MTDWPLVDVIVITYDRFYEIRQTIQSLTERLQYPSNRLSWLIADDATPDPDYLEKLRNWSDLYPPLDNLKFIPSAKNVGWGANANRALRFSAAPYIFQIEDDYVLRKPLNLMAAVAAMEVTPHIGMMRFRGTAGDHLVFHQMEADISKFLPDYREGMGLPGKFTYFLFDSGSPGLYIYSHGAHLKRASFHQHYGYYPEKTRLGQCEEQYAHMVKDMMRANIYSPVIAIQPEWVPMWFDHIGKSRQLTALDPERV